MFRRKHARYQVVCQSAITKMTAGTNRSFHGFDEQRHFTMEKIRLKSSFLKGTPIFLE